MKTGIIYKATAPNKKSYIGCTTYSLEYRKYKHSTRAFCEKDPHFRTKFARAIRKYGPDNFIWEIIVSNVSTDELEKVEAEFIKEFDTVKNGYNTLESSIANYNRGKNLSDSTKSKLRKANLGKKYSKEVGLKHSVSLKKAYAEGRRVPWQYKKSLTTA